MNLIRDNCPADTHPDQEGGATDVRRRRRWVAALVSCPGRVLLRERAGPDPAACRRGALPLGPPVFGLAIAAVPGLPVLPVRSRSSRSGVRDGSAAMTRERSPPNRPGACGGHPLA